MLRVIIHGCNGAMGRMLNQVIANEEGVEIVAGIDRAPNPAYAYPVFMSLDECTVEADAVIDFTVAAAADALPHGRDLYAPRQCGGSLCAAVWHDAGGSVR